MRRILRPLARFMIRRGVTLPRLVDLLKSVLVEIAETDFAINGKPPTDSRVSMLTGVHRKDVRVLRGRAEKPPASGRQAAVAATVIGRWLGDAAFRTGEGAPRVLERGAASADAPPGFDDLVASVSRDIRPRTVLDELLRVGAVRFADPEERAVRLEVSAFAPQGDDSALAFFADNLADHADTAVGNLEASADAPRRLERAVFYNRLHPDAVRGIEAEARQGAMALLSQLNERGLAAQRAARADGGEGPRARIRFGVYFYSDADAPVESDADAPVEAAPSPVEKDDTP